MKTYTIILIQEGKQFEVSVNVAHATGMDKIAGTMAAKVCKFLHFIRKYKASTGFNFARKFSFQLKVNGDTVNSPLFSGLMVNGQEYAYTMSLQNNSKSFDKFATFLGDFTEDCLSTLGQDEVYTIAEAKEEVATMA